MNIRLNSILTQENLLLKHIPDGNVIARIMESINRLQCVSLVGLDKNVDIKRNPAVPMNGESCGADNNVAYLMGV